MAGKRGKVQTPERPSPAAEDQAQRSEAQVAAPPPSVERKSKLPWVIAGILAVIAAAAVGFAVVSAQGDTGSGTIAGSATDAGLTPTEQRAQQLLQEQQAQQQLQTGPVTDLKLELVPGIYTTVNPQARTASEVITSYFLARGRGDEETASLFLHPEVHIGRQPDGDRGPITISEWAVLDSTNRTLYDTSNGQMTGTTSDPNRDERKQILTDERYLFLVRANGSEGRLRMIAQMEATLEGWKIVGFDLFR